MGAALTGLIFDPAYPADGPVIIGLLVVSVVGTAWWVVDIVRRVRLAAEEERIRQECVAVPERSSGRRHAILWLHDVGEPPRWVCTCGIPGQSRPSMQLAYADAEGHLRSVESLEEGRSL